MARGRATALAYCVAALILVDQEREYFRELMEALTCGDLCDKTYEQQGCPSGSCAREEGLKKFDRTTELIRDALNGLPQS